MSVIQNENDTIERQKEMLIQEMNERLRELGIYEVLQVKNLIGELLLRAEKKLDRITK